MKRHRCLAPADLIYEWQKIDVKTKQPYSIGMKDGSLFAFGGLCVVAYSSLWFRWQCHT
jgi:putative SOS response-associated peptidase YedK